MKKLLVFITIISFFSIAFQVQAVTFTKRVINSTDDVTEFDGFVNGLTGTQLITGEHPSIAATYDSGVRFTSVNVPQGTTITNAYITLIADQSTQGTPSISIAGEDVDSAATFSTQADYDGRTRTTATVGWNPSGQSANDSFDTPALTAIVQEIVNRGSWSSGNDMVFFFADGGSSNAWIRPKTQDNLQADAPLLTIIYGGGGEGGSSVAKKVINIL